MAKFVVASAVGAGLASQADAFAVPAVGTPQTGGAACLRGRTGGNAAAELWAAEPTETTLERSSGQPFALGLVGGLALAGATLSGSRSRRARVVKAAGPAEASNVKVGDLIPDVSLDKGFPPEKVSLRDFCRGKKVVLVGLPGAFTPT